jgi:hypothetical protein
MAYADKVISNESGGDPNSSNSNSSASGPAGFINSTWLETLKANRPDIAQGQSDSDLLALKSDPNLAKEMADAYAASNGKILASAGLPVTPGTTYLAHFAGPKGAVGILNADPSTPAGAVLGQAAVKANPFLTSMTAGDVANWANRKMGGAPMSLAGPVPAGGAPATPAQPPPQQQQQQAAPQQVSASASPAPNLAALAAVPQLQNILPSRPNILLGRYPTAPFSLRG